MYGCLRILQPIQRYDGNVGDSDYFSNLVVCQVGILNLDTNVKQEILN